MYESGQIGIWLLDLLPKDWYRGGGEHAGIYKVDINTCEGHQILTIKGAEEVRSIGYLE